MEVEAERVPSSCVYPLPRGVGIGREGRCREGVGVYANKGFLEPGLGTRTESG